MVFYETMQERMARILAELDICAESALEVRCGMRLGRYALARSFCKRRVRFKFNSRRELAFKFKFHPCRAAFKFHHRGRRRLNSAAMRVRHSKHCVAIQGAVKFYFYETRALLFQIYARQALSSLIVSHV